MKTYKIEAWYRYEHDEKDFIADVVKANDMDEAYLIFMNKSGPTFYKVDIEEI